MIELDAVAVRALRLEPSPTLSIAEKARRLQAQGHKIVKLDIGEPDFDTPSFIVEAAIEALKSGATHYTSSRGIPELRHAISEFYGRVLNVDVDPERELIVTPGSKFALYSAIQIIVDEGDEVIILTPAWPTYKSCVKLAGGRIIEVPCMSSGRLDEELLKESITSRTKLLIVNSPNNPTGEVLPPSDLKILVDLAQDHDFFIISDEVYRFIVYDEVKPYTMLSFPEIRDKLVVVDGFSKTWAMTGWRLGFAVAPSELIRYMNMMQQNATTCPTSFVQYAAIKALSEPLDSIKYMIDEYNRRRLYIVNELNSVDGIKCNLPKGAFYVFPDISGLSIDSEQFAEKLLTKAHVCVLPGISFGLGGEHHIRISYATSMMMLKEGVSRIKSFIENELKKT